MTEFIGYPKIPRWSKDIVITEKIDGTNAQILIIPTRSESGISTATIGFFTKIVAEVGDFYILAASRNRFITPEDDNYGFAKWVSDNAEELVTLGPGRHFGEWWGQGIQRNYGQDRKRFSLFHSHGIQNKPAIVDVVPTLYAGPNSKDIVDNALAYLYTYGSVAAPGFMHPEGIIIYHTAAKQLFKKTFEDGHKG